MDMEIAKTALDLLFFDVSWCFNQFYNQFQFFYW